MDISKIKVGSTSYDVKDASARSSISGLGTAAKKDVPSSGNASSTLVVLGSDSRLTNSRPASDVYSWAKQSSKPSYTASEVGLGNVGNFKAVSTVASQGLSDTEKSNARANIGAGTSSFSGSYNDLSNKPSIPAAANNGTYTVKTLVGSTTTNVSDFSANQSSADDVTFVQGSNITITPDATNRKITISSTDTNTWRPLGTTADTACAGNDSRLSNSRPASDVYSWAKASSKPSYSKSEVGLGNVTNDAQVKRTEMGAASGVATLGTDGKVPSSQLPSYVDDVLEYAKLSSFPSTGESGKIYVAQDTNKTYRWSGSTYTEISPSIVVGTTTGTAFDGKSGYDHVNNTSNPHGVTKAQLGLGNVENKSSATIRGELTKSNVTTALGYTPPTTNTTYSNFVKSGSGAAAGLVPAPSTTAGTTKYLREDGTWTTPPDTNTWPTKLSQLSNDTGYITTYTNTVTSINGKTGAIAAADIASVLTAAGYKLTDTDTNTWRPIGTGASDAAAGNHTHAISLATSSGTNQITLAHGTKYALTAGGQTVVFTTPSDNNTVTSINGKTGAIAAADIASVLTAAGYKLTDVDTNTWRPVQCNSTDIGSNTLNIVAGSNVSLSRDGGKITISSTDTNTWPTKVSQLTNDIGYITYYTDTVTSINGKTGAIAAADIASVLTAAGYKLTDTDTNTWRGIQNNLTSTSTTDSLSAYLGYLLANGSARDNTKLSTAGGTITGNLTVTDPNGTPSSTSLRTDGTIKLWSGVNDTSELSISQDSNGRLCSNSNVLAYKSEIPTNSTYKLTVNGTTNGTRTGTSLGTLYAVATSNTTTANQVWMRNSSNNGYGWRTLGSRAFDSTSYLPLSGGTIGGTLTSRDITPSANSTYNLGTADNAYNNIHATYIYGNKGGALSLGNITSSGSWKYDQLVISNNGNVGIGTSSSSYKLDVNGTVHAGSISVKDTIEIYQGGGGAAYILAPNGDDLYFSDFGLYLFDNTIYATGFNNYSDERKKDIDSYDAIADVNDIANAPAVLFKWKDGKDASMHRGTIAQYWQKVMPECVLSDKEGYLSIQYDVIALLSAISIAKEVVTLKDKVSQLEEENAKLNARLEAIEAKLNGK